MPLIANHAGTSGWPSTWHNSTNAIIRALDQSLNNILLSLVEQISLMLFYYFQDIYKKKPAENKIKLKIDMIAGANTITGKASIESLDWAWGSGGALNLLVGGFRWWSLHIINLDSEEHLDWLKIDLNAAITITV